MRFDDRLSTVLGLAAEGAHERAVQWRQLVELVARGAGRSWPELREQALRRIATLMREVPEEVRAAAARSIAGPDVPAELVALFASDTLEVAAPLVTSAELDEAGWAAVKAVASPSVTAMLSALRPAAGTAAPALAVEVQAPTPVEVEPVATPQQRETVQLPPEPQPIPPTLHSGVFRWECGPTGEIDWVEGAPRAAVIGLSLVERLGRHFNARLPFENERVLVATEGKLAGEWRLSGTPSFFPGTGRFAGYHGVARREGGSASEPAAAAAPLDHDSLRELMHELRTPLNAIIGFGEIIGGQYLGPAHRAYRDRATDIVEQARLLLDAVQDLDLSARLRSDRDAKGEGEPFDAAFQSIRLALLEDAVKRDVTLTIAVRGALPDLAVPTQLTERLIRRFLFGVLAVASEGERFELTVDRLGGQLAIAIDRPRAVRGLGEEQMLHPRLGAKGATLGLGFTLRLTRGLASVIGATLEISSDRLVLLLPLYRD